MNKNEGERGFQSVMKQFKNAFDETGMITALIRYRVKAGHEDEFIEGARRLFLETYPPDEDVVHHILLRQRNDPQVYYQLEQFRSLQGLQKHVERECRVLGLPPGSRVIEAARDICEDIEGALYDVVK